MLLNKLQFYIVKQLLSATFIVIFLVIALAFVINLLGELQSIGKAGQNYGFWQALEYVLYFSPYTIYQLAPMLILVGGILGLGSLNTHQELIMMRCSGFSWVDLGKAVFVAAIILIMILLGCGEFIVPALTRKATIVKQNAYNSGQIAMTKSGLWLHEPHNFFHIARVIDKNHLGGITRYQFNDNQKLLAAFYVQLMDYNGKEWILHKIQKSIFLPNGNITSVTIEQDSWGAILQPNLLQVITVQPEELSLVQLSTLMHNLRNNSTIASQFSFALWKRIFQPVVVLSMLFLAIPIVLVAPRANNLGIRIFLGIIGGFAFYFVNTCIGQLSIVYQVSPIMAAGLPALALSSILVAVVGLKKSKIANKILRLLAQRRGKF